MNLLNGIATFLEKTHRTFRRTDGGLLVTTTGGVPSEISLTPAGGDVLAVTATLPAETLPKYTEDVIGAVNTANAFASFGGFALCPDDSAVRFRSYVRLRGDVDSEIGYLLENTENALTKFAPALVDVCRGKMTAAEYTDSWSRRIKDQSEL